MEKKLRGEREREEGARDIGAQCKERRGESETSGRTSRIGRIGARGMGEGGARGFAPRKRERAREKREERESEGESEGTEMDGGGGESRRGKGISHSASFV